VVIKIIFRLLPDQRCQNCGAIGDVEERTLLCLACFGLRLLIERRKAKLETSMPMFYRPPVRIPPAKSVLAG
jgi:hypothetical protein